MCNNKISHIPEQLWDILYRLASLNLKSNSLDTIPDVAGPAMTLKMLKLDENNFKEFPRLGKSLEELFLKKNNITVIDKDAFQGLSSLSYLDLSKNYLQSFPDFHYVKPTI